MQLRLAIALTPWGDLEWRGSMTELAIEQNQTGGFAAPSEKGEVQAGNPQPWGAHQNGDGVNFVLFSRHATRVRLELYQNPDDPFPTKIIELDIGPVRSGMYGCEVFPRVNSTAIASKGLISRKKATASTHISCFWIRLQEQLLASRIGISQLPVATIRAVA